MGWLVSAAAKREICSAATAFGAPAVQTVAIDMNAILRKDFQFCDKHLAPKAAISIFWRNHVLKHPTATTFYFAFDSSSRIPDERVRFLSEERYAAPITTPVYTGVTLDMMPAPWKDVWATGEGKRMLWSVLQRGLQDHIGYRAAPGVTYIIDPPDGPVWGYPAKKGPEHMFGEADTKCIVFATACEEDVLVKTIDWDLAVMGVIANRPNLHIHFGNIWKRGDSVYFSKQKAPPGSARVPEVVTPARLLRRPDIGHSFAFWMLAAGGVDYCKGLKRFGVSEQNSILLMTTTPRFITIEENTAGGRTARFETAVFRDVLKSITLKRARSWCVKEFNYELSKMWYCILYFSAMDPMRARGGPLVATSRFFDDSLCTCQPSARSGCIWNAISEGKCFDIQYVEEHPP